MIESNVWTPNGYLRGPVNSLVGKGESIIDYTNGTGTLVTKGKVGVDNQPSSVQKGDLNVIAGNDIDWTNGIKFSQLVAPLTQKLQMYNEIEKKMSKTPKNSSLSKQTMQFQKAQLDRAKAPILSAMKNITDRQERLHQIEDYQESVKANRGMDRFNFGKELLEKWASAGKGKVSDATIDLGYTVPAALEMQMLNHWNKEKPVMPGTYAANRYAPSALQTLNRLSVDPYSQLQQLNLNDRTAYYRMQQNGGYTGGQRQAGRIALALGNARNAADILNSTQLLNNKYRQDWATAALAEGNQDAARRQAAAQYGWEAYNKAHGQKTKGIETHLANLGLIGQKWLSQRMKNKQYGDILDMYQQDLDMKSKALLAQFGGQGGSAGTGITGTSGSGSTGASGGANAGDLSILQPYYHNNGLGEIVFSINKPYSMPDAPALQRIPKGKYYMMPDTMPLKRYNSDQIRGAIQGNKEAMQYADRMQEYAKGAYGALGYYGPFTWDSTGGFGGNLLYNPRWAGMYFDYNKDSFGK